MFMQENALRNVMCKCLINLFRPQYAKTLNDFYHYSNVTWISLHVQKLAIWMLVQQLFRGKRQRKHQIPHYWPFVMGIHRSSVDSHHKGPVMQKAFPCHYIFQAHVLLRDPPAYDTASSSYKLTSLPNWCGGHQLPMSRSPATDWSGVRPLRIRIRVILYWTKTLHSPKFFQR